MDAYEATKIVFQRIQNLDPQNASKIMGFLLIQDHGEKEMIRLAFGPESLIQTVIIQAKKDLNLNTPSTPSSPSPSSPFTNPLSLSRQNSTSRMIGGVNLPSPLSITNHSSSWTNSSNFSDDLISPTTYNGSSPPSTMNSAAAPFYVGAEVDLIDELHLQDQLSFFNDAPPHRRSCSVSDICLQTDDLGGGFGWKPCLFYARGFCKNGTSCRFLHGEGEMMEPLNFPFSPNRCINFQQPDSPRSLVMGDGMHKFGRGRGEFAMNPGSRQIYLTFPADSTFKEEDVSIYFSNFGPVQDVRIPYQQKRMFGFVTFDFPETVKLILAKGNPHFVCDARVLVKPYKEKGKIPDKHRKQQQQMERGEFPGCNSPESRDPYDLHLGARMLYNTQDLLWRRKLEEQADLQQAIELQNRRLMGLQLLDVKRNSHHRTLSSGAVISSPMTFSPTFFSRTSPEVKEENGSIGSYAAASNREAHLATNANANAKEESEPSIGNNNSPKQSEYLQESLEHNLPESPFASPKAGGDMATAFSNHKMEAEKVSAPSTNNDLITSPSLFPASASLDIAPFKSCYFQVPRFASGHETVGM
ncbi:zinc finger CCCH domain-containing protein 53-like [Salvia splendens]|uniref:zinc finger CCCH domain-containing protein 53-like n=1 Tax=Salvia splendens TaxID=180675 RepID=UPI001C2650A2|nr:zinc finger CCCH domain-containing protein 53-like [Salvia splendens]XP_041995831.1 zinc finger CCCH domain-containing protein 53-like [Salvia splendens]